MYTSQMLLPQKKLIFFNDFNALSMEHGVRGIL